MREVSSAFVEIWVGRFYVRSRLPKGWLKVLSVQSTFLHIKCSLACLRVTPDAQAKLVDSMRPGDWIYEIKFDG